MGKFFFYGIIITLTALFLLILGKKQFGIRHIFLMMSYSLYNLIFELIYGEIFGLYYYIERTHSLIYIIIASVFLYPVIAVLYVSFLPGRKKALWFTLGAIVIMLFLEMASLNTRTIVLTGWKVIPWSVIAYIVSFVFINIINNSLLRVLPDP